MVAGRTTAGSRKGDRSMTSSRYTVWQPSPQDLARWRECYEAHEAGETYRGLGARLGISGVMARQRALKHLQWQSRLQEDSEPIKPELKPPAL